MQQHSLHRLSIERIPKQGQQMKVLGRTMPMVLRRGQYSPQRAPQGGSAVTFQPTPLPRTHRSQGAAASVNSSTPNTCEQE